MTSPEEAFVRHWLTLPDRPDVEEDELPLFMDWLNGIAGRLAGTGTMAPISSPG